MANLKETLTLITDEYGKVAGIVFDPTRFTPDALREIAGYQVSNPDQRDIAIKRECSATYVSTSTFHLLPETEVLLEIDRLAEELPSAQAVMILDISPDVSTPIHLKNVIESFVPENPLMTEEETALNLYRHVFEHVLTNRGISNPSKAINQLGQQGKEPLLRVIDFNGIDRPSLLPPDVEETIVRCVGIKYAPYELTFGTNRVEVFDPYAKHGQHFTLNNIAKNNPKLVNSLAVALSNASSAYPDAPIHRVPFITR